MPNSRGYLRSVRKSLVRSQKKQKIVNVRLARTDWDCVKAGLQPEAAGVLKRSERCFQQPIWLLNFAEN